MKNQISRFRMMLLGKSFCCLVVFLLCFTTNIVAQSNSNEPSEIEKMITQLYTAMVDKNSATLEDLTFGELTYGHSSGQIESKSEFIDGVLNGTFQFKVITPIDQTITIVGDVGLVRHIFKAEGINSGTPATVNIGCLLIFKKKNNNWKLLARQAFKL